MIRCAAGSNALFRVRRRGQCAGGRSVLRPKKKGSFEHFAELYAAAQQLTPERRRDPEGRYKLWKAYGWKAQHASQQLWPVRAAFDTWKRNKFKGQRGPGWKAPKGFKGAF